MPKKNKTQKKSTLPLSSSQENSPRAFNYDPLDLSPSLTDSPCGSIAPSDRFFIPVADVASGSLIEEARLTSSGSREQRSAKIYGWPVVVNSNDPIEDFRRSMEEMMKEMEREEPLDWKQLEELLDAYLEVNERRVYRYIFAAFFDLTHYNYNPTFPTDRMGHNDICTVRFNSARLSKQTSHNLHRHGNY